jgi:cytochrome c biogenesis protein CcmG/thiol:disulfide interchange protein DsbE
MNRTTKALTILSLGILAVVLTFNFLIARANDQAAPDFTLIALDGTEVTLTDFEGKVLFLNFWATWCSPCRQEIPGFLEIYDKYKDEGMEILGVSLDPQGSDVVKPFAEKMKITYPLAMANNEIMQAYQPGQYIPATIIIDREGNIHNKHVGYMDKTQVEKMFLELK